MKGNTIVGIVAGCVFSFIFVLFLLQAFCCNRSSRYNNRYRRRRRTTYSYAPTTITSIPPIPTPAQETGDASDGRSATNSNALAIIQDNDGKVKRVALPPPTATRDKGRSNNLGRPNQQPSTLLPMYMDGSDG